MDKELKEKHTRQTNEIYLEIGRFSVQFEHVSFALQSGIRSLLVMSGLGNQQLANIMLAEQTAYPLKSMLQAMIAEVGNLDETDRQISNKIFKRVGDLIEKRNDVVHSTWFVGWAGSEDTDFSNAGGHKLSRGKGGAGIKGVEYTAADFRALTDECELVAKMVTRLWGVIVFGRKVSNNFVLDSGANVRLPVNV